MQNTDILIEETPHCCDIQQIDYHNQIRNHVFEEALLFTAIYDDNDAPSPTPWVARWCSKTLQDPFILLIVHQCVAGGTSNNSQHWDFYGYTPHNVVKLELRCSNRDATMFLLKFTEDE